MRSKITLITIAVLFMVGVTVIADFSLPNPAVPGEKANAKEVNENWLKPLNILSSYDGTNIKDNSIPGLKLQNNSVDNNKLAPLSVDPSKMIYPFTHTGEVKFLTGEIQSVDILDNTITTGDIKNFTILGEDLSETSVTTALADKANVMYYNFIAAAGEGDTFHFIVYDTTSIDTKLLIIDYMKFTYNFGSNAGAGNTMKVLISDGFTNISQTIYTYSAGGAGIGSQSVESGFNLGDHSFSGTWGGANANGEDFIIDISALSGNCTLNFDDQSSPLNSISGITIYSMKKINIYND